MAAKRLPMRKIREVLRLKHEVGLPHRAIARACSVGVGTVSLYVRRAREAGLGWPLPAELDETALEARLLKSPRGPGGPRRPPGRGHPGQPFSLMLNTAISSAGQMVPSSPPS